jgi:hypothetical protein
MIPFTISLLYRNEVVAVRTVKSRMDEVKTKLMWRKVYGPRYRKCVIKQS